MIKYLKKYNAHSDYIKPVILKAVVSYCKKEVEVHFKKREHDYSKDYLTFESLEDNNQFYFKGTDSTNFQTIQVSTDEGQTWQEKTSSLEGTELFTLNKGQKALIKSNTWHQNGKDFNNYNHFKSVRKYIIYGNIASLLYGDDFENQTSLNGIIRTFQGLFLESKLKHSSNLILPFTTCTNTCYYSMFRYSGNLLDIPKLPATTLAQNCYCRMFNACTNLSTITELPATILVTSCYEYMFDTTNITIPVNLDHVTQLADYCYRNMYANCQKLTYAPNLPLTTLYTGCYQAMFQNCTSIVNSPTILPATTLTTDCYIYMFEGCTNLISTPELPASTIGIRSYRRMFANCTSLVEPPELPATYIGHEGYWGMFEGCTSLQYAPELPATEFQTQYSYNGMFKDCTSLKRAPSILPCTSLVMGCYYRMFFRCINLENAPKLPALTIPWNAYAGMFEECNKINFIDASFTTIENTTTSLNSWLYHVSPTGIFIKNPDAEWDISGASGIPEGWNVFNKYGGYLESTGTQYINTEIIPNADTRMIIDMSIDNTGDVNNGLIDGSRRFHIGKFSGKFHFGIAGSHGFGPVWDTDRHIFELNGNGTAKLDDTSYTISTTPLSGVTIPISLFGRNTNGTTNNFIVGKMWSCKIYNGDTLIMDLVPIEKDNVGYMYDQITFQLFENVGTGNFIYGEDT